MPRLDSTQKKYLLILIVLAVAYFAAFWAPNAAASENRQMVTIFEPDEGAPLPFVLDMLAPANSVNQALRNFIGYGYYFYGFPHFGWSALTLLPQALLGDLGDTAQVMVTLRQFVSVLPMLLAVLVLVYLQTEFRSYKSIALFVFLVALPALVQNNFWWHPDSLAILLAYLALFFLYKDEFHFGPRFYVAAALVGLSAQTKGIGFYFFLTIGVYLLIGWLREKQAFRRILLAALGFLGAMALTYFASNPVLLYGPARQQFFSIMQNQSDLLSEGYEVFYARGLAAAAPIVRQYYGGWLLPLVMLGTTIWAAWRGPRRDLHLLILAWFIPISFFVFTFSHFKYQYWMPVILPIYSSLAVWLPDSWADWRETWRSGAQRAWLVAGAAVLLLAAGQWLLYVRTDAERYSAQLTRAEDNPSIAFHDHITEELAVLRSQEYYVYHDVGVYLPDPDPWTTQVSFQLLTYDYIQENDFDILILMEQRIRDYLNPDVEGIDTDEFARAQRFYGDADAAELDGYQLLYRNEFGLIFVSSDLYDQVFSGN